LCRRPSGEAAANARAQADAARSGAAEGGLAPDAAAALHERATAAEADRDKARVQLLRCGPRMLSARFAPQRLPCTHTHLRHTAPPSGVQSCPMFPVRLHRVLLLACLRQAARAGLVRARRAGEERALRARRLKQAMVKEQDEEEEQVRARVDAEVSARAAELAARAAAAAAAHNAEVAALQVPPRARATTRAAALAGWRPALGRAGVRGSVRTCKGGAGGAAGAHLSAGVLQDVCN